MTAPRRAIRSAHGPHRSLLRVLVTVPFMLLLTAGVAWAYWATSGAGTANATTGTINAPTAVTAGSTAGGSTVTVGWTASAPAAGLTPSGYYVTRVRTSDGALFPACGTSPTSPIAATTCNDTNVPNGTYRYRVTAVKASWTATSALSGSVTVLRDAVSPTVTINQASGQADPTNSGTVRFTVTFSEPVTGFTDSDVAVVWGGGGTRTVTLTGTGPIYTVTVAGMTGTGTVTATIPAGTVTDLAGNPNTASTSTDNTVSIDTIRPTVTINQAAAQADPTNGNTVVFTATFSEPVLNFAPADVTVTGTAGGTKTITVSGSGTTYTVTVSGVTGNGTVIATIAADGANDPAGNLNTASSSTDNTVTRDGTAPTVTINQSAAQADPTANPTVVFTATFSEPVAGFTASDVTVGGTAGGTKTVTVSGPGPVYTVSIAGATSSGTIQATIPAGAVTDAAGNPNTASTSTDNTVTINRVWVKVQSKAAGQPLDNTIHAVLQLDNLGSVPVDLASITMRYWFTAESAAPFEPARCDWAGIGCSNVTLSTVPVSARPGANTYLLVGFNPGATLASSGTTGEIQLRLFQTNWPQLYELDDYSYSASTNLIDTTKVTVYQNGTLIWGTEPSAPLGAPAKVAAGKATEEPTTGMAAEPADEPTVGPTVGPSGEPTVGATAEPTDGPTGEPTDPADQPLAGPAPELTAVVRSGGESD